MSIFWTKVKAYMDERELTYNKFSKMIGTKRTTLFSWIKHDRLPPADLALKIANIMEVELGYLLYGNIESVNENEELLRRIYFRLKKMNTYELHLILNMIKGIIKLDKEGAGD